VPRHPSLRRSDAAGPPPPDSSAPPDGAALPTDARSRRIARIAVAIALVGVALWVAREFLAPLAWAILLAITTWPIYSRFCNLMSRRAARVLAPLLFTVLVGALVIGPVVLTVHQIAQTSDTLVAWTTELRQNGIPVPAWAARLPLVSDYVVAWWQANLAKPEAALAWVRQVNIESVTVWTGALGGELLHRLILFLLTLLMLFIMFRDGAWMAERAVETADRILGDPGERLAGKIADAVRGTVNGTVVLAVAQGMVIGIAYVAADVPNPALFVLMTIAFGMLPFGAWAVFIAAAIVVLAQGGSVWAGVFVVSFGATVMTVANLVWPALVGSTAQLPFLLALIGIFGGLQTFGLVGLFVGPVIMAVLLTIWREWLESPAAPAD